jgi:hypothetical protein
MNNSIDRQAKESILDDMVEVYTQVNILVNNKMREYGRLDHNDIKYDYTRMEINVLIKKINIYTKQYPALPYHFKYIKNMEDYRATQ